MEAISVHRIAILYRIFFVVGGIFMLVLAGGGLIDVIDDPLARHARILTPVFFALFLLIGIGGLWLLWLFLTRENYKVQLGAHGILVGSGRWIKWNEITSVRESAFGQRLLLLDLRGALLARVEYQIEDAESVVRYIRDRIPPQPEPDVPPQSRFGSRRWQWALIGTLNAAVITFFVLLWITSEDRPWWAAVIALVFLVVMNREGWGDAVQLDVADDALVIRTMTRTRRIPRDQVLDVTYQLQGDWQVKVHRCAVVLNDGTHVEPPGAVDEKVYLVLKRWLGRDRVPVFSQRDGIVTIGFEGLYPAGSDGNDFAAFMAGHARKIIADTNPEGVIFDLSRLHYEWGDAIGQLAFALHDPANGTVRPGVVVATGSTARVLEPLFAPNFVFGALGVALVGTHAEALRRIQRGPPERVSRRRTTMTFDDEQ